MTCVLSLDFGTGGVRVGVYDLDRRRLAGIAEAGYPTRHIRPNRAEQDPLDWWNAACRATPAALRAAGGPEIAAICVAAFASTVVVADRQGNPLAPAILWMDARAAAEAEFTGTVDHPVMEASGGSDAVEWLVPKAMWLARNQPELWGRVEVCCEALDFINHRLTGVWAGSLMNATCKWNYDSRNRRFCPELYEAFGVPELADKLPAHIVDIGGTVGRLTAEAGRQLGIGGAPIVVQGGIDAHMGIFGAATVGQGEVLLIGGTSNVFLIQVPDDGMQLRGVWGPYPDAAIPGVRLVEAGQVSAGSVLSWLSDTIFGLDPAGLRSLWSDVERIHPGETGLLTLDYFMGNRTPYRDATLRGAVLGLSLSHDRASLYRSAMNSVALGSLNIVDDLQRQGQEVTRLVVAGGIKRNPLWLQATIDALGLPAWIAEDDNLTLVGCAAASAFGLGLFPSLADAAAGVRAPATKREPDRRNTQAYRALLSDYREATALLQPVLRRLSTGGGPSP